MATDPSLMLNGVFWLIFFSFSGIYSYFFIRICISFIYINSHYIELGYNEMMAYIWLNIFP